MSEQYRIYQIDPDRIISGKEIDDGMLRKDWYRLPELGECLFKEAQPTQAIISEVRADWSEKVVNELAELLNLPVARYEFATGFFDESLEIMEGVISVNCIPENNDDVLTGESFLTQIINYDGDDPRQYTIENVLNALDVANVKPPSNWQHSITQIDTGAKLFVGYMMLDCLVNNSDRHDHNWGIMSVEDNLELIPSFDHGLSLGSTDEDEDKPNLIISDYVERYSQSCFQEGYNKVPTLTVFDRAARLYPDAARIWQGKLAAITSSQINEIFDRIPEARITSTADRFARRLLEYNREKILNVNLELPQTLSVRETSALRNRDRSSTGVTLKQLIDLKNYYLNSPEGKAQPESVDAQKNFKRYKAQISKDGKAVSGNPDLRMTNEFFDDFKSEAVTLLPEDRANLDAAYDFATEQQQIKVQARAQSEKEPKQRSRGFSR